MTRPQDCFQDNSTYWDHVSVLSSAVTDQFTKEWTKYAPEYIYGLQTHEWQKHGTCFSYDLVDTATDQDALNAVQSRYFQNQLNLLLNNTAPAIFMAAVKSGKPIAIETVQEAFGGADFVLLSCDDNSNNQYLNSV